MCIYKLHVDLPKEVYGPSQTVCISLCAGWSEASSVFFLLKINET